MSNELQYELMIENGKVKSETGSFFKAAPFQVIGDGKTIDIEFLRGTEDKVVYQIRDGQKILGEYTHPDYIPECAPEKVELPEFIIAAMLHLKTSKDAAYNQYFLEEKFETYTFHVKQPTLKIK